jgi:Zn-dependent protease
MFFEPAPTRFDLNFRLLGVWVRVHPMHWVFSVILGLGFCQGGAEILIWVICVFLSILLHEMGHLLTMRLFGSDGHIVLYSFGGLAVPYHHLPSRWQRMAVSFAGPLAQLILYGLLRLFLIWVAWKEFDLSEKAWFTLGVLIFINLTWAILNLFPIWPLDGGQMCRELFTWFSRRSGVRVSLMLSISVSGILAIHFLAAYFGRPLIPILGSGGIYTVLLFASLAFGSVSALKQDAAIHREWNDEPWRDPDDDGEAWKR